MLKEEVGVVVGVAVGDVDTVVVNVTVSEVEGEVVNVDEGDVVGEVVKEDVGDVDMVDVALELKVVVPEVVGDVLSHPWNPPREYSSTISVSVSTRSLHSVFGNIITLPTHVIVTSGKPIPRKLVMALDKASELSAHVNPNGLLSLC